MLPLADDSRRPSRLPVITMSIIAVNFLAFLLELGGGDAFISRWSLVPAHIVAGRDWITILTAMFLHAGWSHIGAICLLLGFWPRN